MAQITPRIALLSTGDELVNGDVLNTNSYSLAQKLFDHFIQPGLHLTAGDDQNQIESAIQYLLKDHTGLIITGGLGPTSDDRTRFALSKVLQSELIFDETTWQRIIARLQRASLPIPDTNRQQCLFPDQAIIFPNENGTAAACMALYEQKPVFMLPGPPFECFPIFDQYVLPYLQKHHFSRPLYRYEWLLLAVSEGSIAAELDPLAYGSGCDIGYRINQPYLEVKLQSRDAQRLEILQPLVNNIIEKYSVSNQKQKASTQLIELIAKGKYSFIFNDQATGGALETILLSPLTYPFLQFRPEPHFQENIHVELTDLLSYWQNLPQATQLNITITYEERRYPITLSIPFRKERTLLFAVEMACWEILKILTITPYLDQKSSIMIE